MKNVKLPDNVLKPQKMLTVSANAPFNKIITRLAKTKGFDAIWIKKPNATQMIATILMRLSGKKFLWIQSFSNPPASSFITRLMLNQTDIIITSSKKDINKLKNFGIDKPKIKINKE